MVRRDQAEGGLSEPSESGWIVGAPAGVDRAALEAEVERRSTALPETLPGPDLPPPFAADDDALARARQLVDRPGVAYQIGWRTPLLGQAWAKVRETIHAEARLYVDALMARQAELDAALLASIEELRAEVAELRRRAERGA